jgi:predicted regulator of Ras-like GTPase activity (Roadblock/LC7/MglB family)
MDALVRLNAVPGVVGSMAFDARGRVLAQAFPPAFDAAALKEAAAALVERGAGLQTAVGPVRTIDLRYANSRIVVRVVDGVRLLFLCTPAVNTQTLLMSASGAARALEGLVAGGASATPTAAAAPAGSQLYRLVQRIDEVIVRSGLDRFKVRGKIAFKAGFSLDLVEMDSPDDPGKLQKLKSAASEILGQPL